MRAAEIAAVAADADERVAVVAAGGDGRDVAMVTQNDNTTAAVAAQDDSLEAAVALSPRALAEIHLTQAFALNPIALKWIRDTHESPPGWPTVDWVELTDTDPLQIGVADKSHGQDRWITNRQQPWSWRQMLAGMSPSYQAAVLGVNGSSPCLGVTRVACAPSIHSYDGSRVVGARQAGRLFDHRDHRPVWDFYVTRTDGNTVRFHLESGRRSFRVFQVSILDGSIVHPTDVGREIYVSETGTAGSGQIYDPHTESPHSDICHAGARPDSLEHAQLIVVSNASRMEVDPTCGQCWDDVTDRIGEKPSKWLKLQKEFHVQDDDGIVHTAQWIFAEAPPLLRKSGFSGWALVDGEEMRLHVCFHKPCTARHAPSKYGHMPAPMHCRLVATRPPSPITRDGEL